jgi:hypothetical protein
MSTAPLKFTPPPRIGRLTLGAESYDIVVARFPNDRIAVVLEKNFRLWIRVAMNVPAQDIAEDEFFAKTHDENEEFREPLLATGLFADTGRRLEIGFVELELWRLVSPVA